MGKFRNGTLVTGGNKAVTKNKFTLRRLAELLIGGEGMREYIGNPNVLDVVVGDAEKASKDKKKKSEPLELNPIPLQGSVVSQRLVASMPSLQELMLRGVSSHYDNSIYESFRGSEYGDGEPGQSSSASSASNSLYESFPGSEDEDGKPGDQKVMSRRGFSNGLGGLTKSPHEGPYYETIPDARPIKGEVVASFVENHYMATPRVH